MAYYINFLLILLKKFKLLILNAVVTIIINIPARMIFAVFPITGELVLNKGFDTLLFFTFTTFDAISCKAP